MFYRICLTGIEDGQINLVHLSDFFKYKEGYFFSPPIGEYDLFKILEKNPQMQIENKRLFFGDNRNPIGLVLESERLSTMS